MEKSVPLLFLPGRSMTSSLWVAHPPVARVCSISHVVDGFLVLFVICGFLEAHLQWNFLFFFLWTDSVAWIHYVCFKSGLALAPTRNPVVTYRISLDMLCS